ncbi:response regulator transcription factor [Paenibacillus xerothermodurans]|uniref:Response regulator n=1 Tax=Paenibacillus xerothermodurans TaxID=1977292 RepID=A0A2W1P375_PAEXE|nr:response regulator [Paenibacillus xerothermodurans]PZE22162.1 response regulator [Paenibacillus xerothermodurans]
MTTIFRLLIVEDEPWIRKSLEKILPWNELGIEYAGCARNGQEAFSIIVNSSVDLVITDIKMPKMDGFKLMDSLAEYVNPTPKYMIISGYDDFHYAKNAIKQGVLDYILKPVDPKELRASVLKAVDKLKIERSERDNLRKLRIKDYVYERISHPTSEVNHDLLPENSCYCFLFSIHSVYQELSEQLGTPGLTYFALPLGAYYLYFLMASSEQAMQKRVMNAIDAIRKNHIIGISKIRMYRDHSFYQALKETEHDYLLNDKNSISLKTHMPYDIALSSKDEIYLLEALQAREKDKILHKVNQFLHTCEYFEQQWVAHFQLYLFFGKYVSNTSGFAEQVLWLHDLKNIKTSNELKIWRHKGLEPMIDEIMKIEQKKAPDHFLQAVKYVEKHYLNASLSLESVARYLNLSTPYLSNIFNARGENYTAYVTKKRVDKAKQLLLDSDLTIYEVSEASGFNDVKYFIHVFKKETLYTPNNFRKLKKHTF